MITLPIRRTMKAKLMDHLPVRGRGCWEYSGFRNPAGYGFIYGWTSKLAHRVAYEVLTGQRIPNGLMVCHRCDNPPCCNPKHLFLGTARDNNRDRILKGRFLTGRRFLQTDEERRKYREALNDLSLTCADVARMFGGRRSSVREDRIEIGVVAIASKSDKYPVYERI